MIAGQGGGQKLAKLLSRGLGFTRLALGCSRAENMSRHIRVSFSPHYRVYEVVVNVYEYPEDEEEKARAEKIFIIGNGFVHPTGCEPESDISKHNPAGGECKNPCSETNWMTQEVGFGRA